MDRESYEADLFAQRLNALEAEQQQRQERKDSVRGFIDAAGKTALGLGAAAGAIGAGVYGRRLMRGRQQPQKLIVEPPANKSGKFYRREQVNENAAQVAKEWGEKRQGSLVTGVKLPSASEVAKDKGNFPIQKANTQDLAKRGASDIADPWFTNLGATPETPGQLPRSVNTFDRSATPGSVQVADKPTRPDPRLPAAEAEYNAPGRIEPQEFASSAVQQARREAAKQDILASAQTRNQTFQPEIPGIKGDLMSIRSKTGLDPAVTGELVAEAPSRPITSKPDQLNIDFKKSYLKDQGYVDAGTSVQVQEARRPLVAEQAVEAADSGMDQEAMRVSRTVQRDPDENLANFDRVQDSLEERGANPVQAAEQAVEQIEGTPAFTQTDAPIDPREKSQQFLQKRFDEMGSTVRSPMRRERALSNDPQIKEAYELYASTGDPSVLSRLSDTPSSPLKVTLKEGAAFDSPEIQTKELYKPTKVFEPTDDLNSKDIDLTNRISALEQEKLDLAARRKELGEQELMLRAAMDKEPPGQDSYSKMLGNVKYQEQNLPSPDSLNADISDAMNERDFTRRQIATAEGLGPRYKLKDRQEGTRIYHEVDQDGRVIRETMEVRGGRPAIDTELKSGGGRRSVEYNPGDQSGNRKGLYGTESTKYGGATPYQKPTQYTNKEFYEEALAQSYASPEGDVPIPPPSELVSRDYGPKPPQKTLQASERIRQIRGANPPEKAEALVTKFLEDLRRGA